MGPGEQYQLYANSIAFHELSHAELQVACVELARVLLLRGASTIVDTDHLLLWTWIMQLLHSVQPRDPEAEDVHKLLALCVRAALASTRPPAADRHAWELQQKVEDLIPDHLRWLGIESHVVLTYLAFPALEGILKLSARAFVDLSGNVRAAFTVPPRTGSRLSDYAPAGTGKGRDRCSSLRDLLLLHSDRVAVDPLRARIAEMRDHIGSLHPGQDGFDVLFDWRNASLHGAESYPTIGGTVLTLALLIALEGIAAGFESLRVQTCQAVERDQQIRGRSLRAPWSFYPPY